MFGHQDDQPAATANNPAGATPTDATTTSTDPSDQPSGQPAQSTPPLPPDLETAEPAAATPPPTPALTPTDNTAAPAWQHPGTPIDSNKETNEAVSPAGGYPMRPTYQYAAGAVPTSDNASITTNNDSELIEIKDKALDELSPLIDKLNLTPEEKFRTLMMMIQASDNQDLVKEAYASAHAIPDEKARAQALLDIINEVNYFTSPHDKSEDITTI